MDKDTQTINITTRNKRLWRYCFTNFNPTDNPLTQSVNHKSNA